LQGGPFVIYIGVIEYWHVMQHRKIKYGQTVDQIALEITQNTPKTYSTLGKKSELYYNEWAPQMTRLQCIPPYPSKSFFNSIVQSFTSFVWNDEFPWST
jgi:hypothetical protein